MSDEPDAQEPANAPDPEGDVSKSAPTGKVTGEGGGSTVDDELIGRTVDRYKIEGVLGQGGFGAVYLAEHTLMKRKTAFKTLHKDLVDEPGVLQRFLREGQVAARFNHEHAIEIYDFGQMEDGTYFMAMEFLQGDELREVLKKRGALPVEEAFDIVMMALQALAASHEGGVVHRDMKPDNIHLESIKDRDDFVKVIDFGIAKVLDEAEEDEADEDLEMVSEAEELLAEVGAEGDYGDEEGEEAFLTQAGAFFGTPEYGSPEQCAGEAIDHRSDLYSMGVILYECITGALPFTSKTPQGYLAQHMVAQPRSMAEANPELEDKKKLPDAVEQLVMKAMAKDPDERFQTAEEMLIAMEEVADQCDIPITVTGAAQLQGSNLALAVGGTVAFLALLATVIWFSTRETDYDRLIQSVQSQEAPLTERLDRLGASFGDYRGDETYEELLRRHIEDVRSLDGNHEGTIADALEEAAEREVDPTVLVPDEWNDETRRAARVAMGRVRAYNEGIAALHDLDEGAGRHRPHRRWEIIGDDEGEETESGEREITEESCSIPGDVDDALSEARGNRSDYAGQVAEAIQQRAPGLLDPALEGDYDPAELRERVGRVSSLLRTFPEEAYGPVEGADETRAVGIVNRTYADLLIAAARRAAEDYDWDAVNVIWNEHLPSSGYDLAARRVEDTQAELESRRAAMEGSPDLRARSLYYAARAEEARLRGTAAGQGAPPPIDAMILRYDRVLADPMAETLHGRKANTRIEELVAELVDEARDRWEAVAGDVNEIRGREAYPDPDTIREALRALTDPDRFDRDRYDANPAVSEHRDACPALARLENLETRVVSQAEQRAFDLAREAWSVMRPAGRVLEAIERLRPWATIPEGQPDAVQALLEVEARDGREPEEHPDYPNVVEIVTHEITIPWEDGALRSVRVLPSLERIRPFYTWYDVTQEADETSPDDPPGRVDDLEDAWMVLVPAGPFLMGDDRSFNAQPRRLVELPAYLIDRREVTVDDFLLYLDVARRDPTNRDYCPAWIENRAPRRGSPDARLPMRNLTHEQASNFAAFLGKSLPTEAQWEKAAIHEPGADERRGMEEARRVYPWGVRFDPNYVRFAVPDEGPRSVELASSAGRSAVGCLDMAGNVAEWTAGFYTSYPECPAEYRDLPHYGQTHRVVRGGSFADSETYMLHGTYRLGEVRDGEAEEWIGFRCVLPLQAEE